MNIQTFQTTLGEKETLGSLEYLTVCFEIQYIYIFSQTTCITTDFSTRWVNHYCIQNSLLFSTYQVGKIMLCLEILSIRRKLGNLASDIKIMVEDEIYTDL